MPAEDRVGAFEALVSDVYVPVQRYLRRRADAATADDALGDVLLVLWRRFDELPDEAQLAWCFGVARGCLANRVRGEQRQRRLLHRMALERPEPSVASADPALDDALASLNGKEQELLRLWAWEGLAPREIAVVLGISANAASIRLHRVIGRLREVLGAKEMAATRTSTGRQGTEADRD